MTHDHDHRPELDEKTRRRFAALALLDRVVSFPRAWPTGLVNHPEDYLLSEVFNDLVQAGLVEVTPEGYFHATPSGKAAQGLMLRQQQSYLFNFNIYALVDLAEGVFADPDNVDPEDPRWSDLRVAVAEYKGMDPYRLVFMAMLAGGVFFENPDWRRDLAPDSPFFQELEDIVQSQLSIEDLAFETEEGEAVPGEAVIEDVILQGAVLNQERLLDLLEQEGEEAQGWPLPSGDQPDDGEGEAGEASAATPEAAHPPEELGDTGWVPYEPEGPMERYQEDPAFVESLWLDPAW